MSFFSADMCSSVSVSRESQLIASCTGKSWRVGLPIDTSVNSVVADCVICEGSRVTIPLARRAHP